jgi:hypothetical protein
MIDTIDGYDLNDKISEAVVTALIDSSLEFYTKRDDLKILVKITLPSELYPRLSISNQEKVEGKMQFILWKYKDLVSLLAKRYYCYVNKTDNNGDLKMLDNFKNAKDYLYRYMPKVLDINIGLKFDTLSYIIRHTQKKPRQVILLLNIILTLAEEQQNDSGSINEDQIKQGIHARLDILTNGSLDAYKEIFSNPNLLAKRVLSGSHGYFKYSELDVMLKEVASLARESNLTRDDVRFLLVQSGTIGIIDNESDISNEETKIIQAIFEYQIKGNIILNNNSICFIHPMFYQEFQIYVDMNKFVYPKPAEDEEIESLRENGIILA